MTFSVLEKNKSQVELYRMNNRNEVNKVFILFLMQLLFPKKKRRKGKMTALKCFSLEIKLSQFSQVDIFLIHPSTMQ